MNDTWFFDVNTYTWERIGDTGKMSPLARFEHSATSFEGNMYIFGGTDGGQRSHGPNSTFLFGPSAEMNDLWCFSICNRHWERIEGMGECPSARSEHGSAWVCNHLYKVDSFVHLLT